MFARSEVNQVRRLLAESFGNPATRAARAARAQYIQQLFMASLAGDDVDAEAAEWLKRLRELCEAHKGVTDIARWYEIETARLQKLIG